MSGNDNKVLFGVISKGKPSLIHKQYELRHQQYVNGICSGIVNVTKDGSAIFPIERWNDFETASEGIARTTHSIESWHHEIQALC